MRLFVALYPDLEVRQHLVQLQAQLTRAQAAPSHEEAHALTMEGHLRTPRTPWRPTPAEQLHLTLQFLGDGLTIHQQEEVEKALESVGKSAGGAAMGDGSSTSADGAKGESRPAAPLQPFEMECQGVGAFPTPQRATVLWAGVHSLALAELARGVNEALSPLGIKPDKPFSPHVTVARSKYPHQVEAFVQANAQTRWSEKPWRVEKFALVESVTVLGGYEHQVLKEYRRGNGV